MFFNVEQCVCVSVCWFERERGVLTLFLQHGNCREASLCVCECVCVLHCGRGLCLFLALFKQPAPVIFLSLHSTPSFRSCSLPFLSVSLSLSLTHTHTHTATQYNKNRQTKKK